jgi:YgiT-type zinc finger domain-containing protein
MCKSGETRTGKSTVKLTIGDTVIVFQNVPSEICHDCSEEYITEDDTRTILENAKMSSEEGITIKILDWDKVKELK